MFSLFTSVTSGDRRAMHAQILTSHHEMDVSVHSVILPTLFGRRPECQPGEMPTTSLGWMPTGRAECRPQLLTLGQNADTRYEEQESNQTKRKSKTKHDSRV